jgi:hypothetical protein
MISAVAGIAVVCVMGTLTVAMSASDAGSGGVTTINADTTTQGPPGTSPQIASAAPTAKATAYVGGDWAGMGKFKGGDWPGP